MIPELARAEIERIARTREFPSLTDGEVEAIAAAHLRYTDHEASTAYEAGQRVALTGTDFNGRIYECVRPGTSGTSLSAACFPGIGRGLLAEFVTDGTAIWQDKGPRPSASYDINGAVRDALLARAAQVANREDVSDDGGDMKRSQVHAQLLEQAARYERHFVA